jgi:hypothetical protein
MDESTFFFVIGVFFFASSSRWEGAQLLYIIRIGTPFISAKKYE